VHNFLEFGLEQHRLENKQDDLWVKACGWCACACVCARDFSHSSVLKACQLHETLNPEEAMHMAIP
jgi:hypothetical protein